MHKGNYGGKTPTKKAKKAAKRKHILGGLGKKK